MARAVNRICVCTLYFGPFPSASSSSNVSVAGHHQLSVEVGSTGSGVAMKVPMWWRSHVRSTSQCPIRPFDHSSVKWGRQIPNVHFNGETEDWLMDLEGFPTFSTHGAMWFISGGLLRLLHDAARGHCDVFAGAKNVEDIQAPQQRTVHPGRPWLLSTNYLEKMETWICRF